MCATEHWTEIRSSGLQSAWQFKVDIAVGLLNAYSLPEATTSSSKLNQSSGIE